MDKCVVKITIGTLSSYNHVEEVVYYRSGMTPDFIGRWIWYFEYLAALVKVRNPRRNVEFFRGPQDVLLGKEWHEYRRLAMIKSRNIKLKKLEKGIVDDDLFGFKSQDNEAKKSEVIKQLDALERDKFPIPEFPEYINKIKKWI